METLEDDTLNILAPTNLKPDLVKIELPDESIFHLEDALNPMQNLIHKHEDILREKFENES